MNRLIILSVRHAFIKIQHDFQKNSFINARFIDFLEIL